MQDLLISAALLKARAGSDQALSPAPRVNVSLKFVELQMLAAEFLVQIFHMQHSHCEIGNLLYFNTLHRL